MHNPLYQNIVINHDLLASMHSEFILKSILLRIIVIENDSSKRMGYEANLIENNEENNLYHDIGTVSINELGILSGCIYTNINKFKQNSYLKLISTIDNFFDNNGVEDHNNKTRPVISYNLHSDGKPLND